MQIDKINFHDKVLLGIEIKSEVDYLDNILITVQDKEDVITIHCKDCISLNIVGNAWIQGRDSIRELYLEKAIIDEKLARAIPETILKKLRRLYINLNTSNSIIEIVACEINSYFDK